jgi:alanine dehydrogenase
VLKIASDGVDRLEAADAGFRAAINMREGRVLNRAVGDAHGLSVADS